MERDYDLFEEFPDGLPLWRGRVSGLREARLGLFELSKITKNECFAIHLATEEIVARVNVGAATGEKPLVFQISYASQLGEARSEFLKRQGFNVLTVYGNDAAKLVLRPPEKYDLFIVGHAAPEPTRREMVEWLKEKYPGVRILALNAPGIPNLVGADYNVKLNGPETLLPVICSALADGHSAGSAAG